MTSWSRFAASLVTASFFFAACGATPVEHNSSLTPVAGLMGQPPVTEVPPNQGPPREAGTQTPLGGYTIEELYSDYSAALNIVNNFWVNHWDEYFTGEYSPPSLVRGSLGAGIYDAPEEQVLCKGKPLPDGNAVYCGPPYDPSQDYVAYDMDLLLRARELGDSLIYMAVAHEWGHAVAARLQSTLVHEAYELQADCFAGATLQGAINDGTLVVQSGDPAEIIAGLRSLADKLPWGSTYIDEHGDMRTATHGNATERISAFKRGISGGPRACVRL